MASLCYFRVAFIFQTDIIFIVKSDYLRLCLGDEWWYVNLLISFCGVAMGNGYLSVKRTLVTMANTQYRFKVYYLLRLTVYNVWNFLGILSVIFLEWMKFICAIYCNISRASDPVAGWGGGGGQETWNQCGCLWRPSFLWLICTGLRGAWPPRQPPWIRYWSTRICFFLC